VFWPPEAAVGKQLYPEVGGRVTQGAPNLIRIVVGVEVARERTDLPASEVLPPEPDLAVGPLRFGIDLVGGPGAEIDLATGVDLLALRRFAAGSPG
jgi:hypothetical protein